MEEAGEDSLLAAGLVVDGVGRGREAGDPSVVVLEPAALAAAPAVRVGASAVLAVLGAAVVLVALVVGAAVALAGEARQDRVRLVATRAVPSW